MRPASIVHSLQCSTGMAFYCLKISWLPEHHGLCCGCTGVAHLRLLWGGSHARPQDPAAQSLCAVYGAAYCGGCFATAGGDVPAFLCAVGTVLRPHCIRHDRPQARCTACGGVWVRHGDCIPQFWSGEQHLEGFTTDAMTIPVHLYKGLLPTVEATTCCPALRSSWGAEGMPCLGQTLRIVCSVSRQRSASPFTSAFTRVALNVKLAVTKTGCFGEPLGSPHASLVVVAPPPPMTVTYRIDGQPA